VRFDDDVSQAQIDAHLEAAGATVDHTVRGTAWVVVDTGTGSSRSTAASSRSTRRSAARWAAHLRPWPSSPSRAHDTFMSDPRGCLDRASGNRPEHHLTHGAGRPGRLPGATGGIGRDGDAARRAGGAAGRSAVRTALFAASPPPHPSWSSAAGSREAARTVGRPKSTPVPPLAGASLTARPRVGWPST
jgi:hypothetical protein